MDTTYRLVALDQGGCVGKTAASPALAKMVPDGIPRDKKLGIEQTDWIDHFGKMKVHRTILIDAETHPGQWTLGE